MIHIHKIIKNKGFTLVEMLVSIAVFMSVMVVAVSSLLSIIDANKKAQNIKSVIDNVTFAVESISRDMRVGTNYQCSLSATSLDFATGCGTSGGKAIQYSNGVDTIQYRYVNGANLLSTDGGGNIQKRTIPDTTWYSMTAPTSTVNITNMSFYVLGTSAGQQPRVIITAEGQIINKNTTTEFNLQTTASERARQLGN